MVSKSLKSLVVLVFGVLGMLLSSSNTLKAQDSLTAEHAQGAPSEAYDPGKSIIHHVLDSHEFHFFTVGSTEAVLPLPIIVYNPNRGFSTFCSSQLAEGKTYDGYKLDEESGKIISADANDKSAVYDFSITKSVFQMIIASILLIIIMTSVAKKYKKNGSKVAPSGFQNAVEPVITFVRDDVAKQYLGGDYKRFMPFLLTIFFFILINNLLGLIPGAGNVTGNIAVTLALSLITFIAILTSTTAKFWGHVFWFPGVPVLVKIIMIPVELLSLVIKPCALMIRLFANMTAGHIVILSFVSLIFIFGQMNPVAGWGFSPVSIAFVIFMDFVELLVAFIQAFIFTNLAAVFIGQSIVKDHH